ncbi:Cdc7p-Dbf4p kinase complex regulatory subunit [Basidiobolus ranarum]|uniref:Cdc7p-Dbf4p kinase complex regulatory subunit n=1 Tax=Basidiobolus ranarum TaxID=34480 RepID=A0ABR2W657_9FUNG
MEVKSTFTDDENNPTINSVVEAHLQHKSNEANMTHTTLSTILRTPDICAKKRRNSFDTNAQIVSLQTPSELTSKTPKRPKFHLDSARKDGELLSPVARPMSFDLAKWVKTYRKAFPSFSFYFDHVDETLQKSFASKIRILGGGVEPFFSSKVTHLITTRPISPPETRPNNVMSTVASPRQLRESPKALPNMSGQNILLSLSKDGPKSTRTTNCPERQSEQAIQEAGNARPLLPSLTNAMMSPISMVRKSQQAMMHTPGKVNQPVFGTPSTKANTITKARQWGMKVWSVEKLTNILKHLLNTPFSTPIQANRNLGDVLRDEKVYGLSTHHSDTNGGASDIHTFRQVYLLVEDTSGTYKPVMVGEFIPPTDGRDPPWPKIHRNSEGRCPFIRYEDPIGSPSNPLHMITPKRGIPNKINSNASGLVNSVTSAYASSTRKSRVINCVPPKEIEKLGRRVLTPSRSVERAGISSQKATDSSKKMGSVRINPTRKPGYCENCRLKFEDLEEHVHSRTHRKFVSNSEHYAELDALLSGVQRLPIPVAVEPTYKSATKVYNLRSSSAIGLTEPKFSSNNNTRITILNPIECGSIIAGFDESTSATTVQDRCSYPTSPEYGCIPKFNRRSSLPFNLVNLESEQTPTRQRRTRPNINLDLVTPYPSYFKN